MIKTVILATNDVEMMTIENILKKEKDFKIVGKSKDVQSGIKMIEQFKPDLIIFNIFKDIVDAKGYITSLRYGSENCKIVLKMTDNTLFDVRFAMNVEVDYIMQKNIAPEVFINHCKFLLYNKVSL